MNPSSKGKHIKAYTIVIILGFIVTKYIPKHVEDQTWEHRILREDSLEMIGIDDAFGPESMTFDPKGEGPYAGVSDGRILKWDPLLRLWLPFAFTSPSPSRKECENKKQENQEGVEDKCGRPLGLCFSEQTGQLYIADAYMGLMVVGPEGGAAQSLVTHVDGIPIGFTNGLDIHHQTGLVYFTSSSTLYPRRNYMSVILSKDKSGRLLEYNPVTRQAKTLLSNLTFPNGVSLSKNKDSLLLIETTTCRVTRYWLPHSTKPGLTELFAQLPGFPDNIKMNAKGEYWVGIYSKRDKFLKWALSSSWLGNTIVNLPYNGVKLTSIIARLKAIGLAVKLDEDGKIVQVLEDKSGKLKFVSEVVEKDGHLWFASVILPYATLYEDYDSKV